MYGGRPGARRRPQHVRCASRPRARSTPRALASPGPGACGSAAGCALAASASRDAASCSSSRAVSAAAGARRRHPDQRQGPLARDLQLQRPPGALPDPRADPAPDELPVRARLLASDDRPRRLRERTGANSASTRLRGPDVRRSRVRLAAAASAASCLRPRPAIAGSYEVSLLHPRRLRRRSPRMAGRRYEPCSSGLQPGQCGDHSQARRPGRARREYPRSRTDDARRHGSSQRPVPPIGGYSLWRRVRPRTRWTQRGRLDARVPPLGRMRTIPWDFASRTGVEGRRDRRPSVRAAWKSECPVFGCEPCERRNVEVKRLFALMECVAEAPACPPVADPGQLRIYAARIGLTDTRSPAFSRAPAGIPPCHHALPSRASDRSVSPPATRGAGSRASAFRSMAVAAVSRSLAEDEPALCRALHASPCRVPLTADTTLALDTATLSNGPHAVQASVTDAAGNETRSDPVVVTTHNGSRPNGRGASRFVKLAAWLRSRKRRHAACVGGGAVRVGADCCGAADGCGGEADRRSGAWTSSSRTWTGRRAKDKPAGSRDDSR